MKILQTLHISNPLSSLLQLLSFLKLLSVLALILLFIVPHQFFMSCQKSVFDNLDGENDEIR
jgi:hypothetical protein